MQRFKRNSRRVGLIAHKLGLVNFYDAHGKWHLCTVLNVQQCHIVQIKHNNNNKLGYINIQVGTGTKKLKNATLPEIGHCAKALLPPKKKLVEFKVTPDAVVQPGTQLRALHFVPGQLVDVTATSKGKGFAGVMKRYGFKGQPASHGVSKSHRGMGSSGQCQDPGKVWPGKKMPGRMGGKRVTQSKMKVVRIDPVKDLIYIKGSIPGPKGGMVFLRDAWLAKQPINAPFPTHFPSEK
jgi:large subunit ribosomal protein L3